MVEAIFVFFSILFLTLRQQIEVNCYMSSIKTTNLSVHKLIFIKNIWLLEKVYVPLQPYGRNI